MSFINAFFNICNYNNYNFGNYSICSWLTQLQTNSFYQNSLFYLSKPWFNNFTQTQTYQNPSYDFSYNFNQPPRFDQFINTPIYTQPNFTQPDFSTWFNNTNFSISPNFGTSTNTNTFNVDTFTPSLKTNTRSYGSLQEKYYKTALSYVDKINSDKTGNAEFSNGRNEEWCANMVTTLAHRTFGDKLPEGLPDGRKTSVASKSIAKWADKHNRWLEAPKENLAKYIAQNVKPGDIVILDRGGAKGHAAIVTEVNEDGSFNTVEGNMSNSVKTLTRPAKINQPYGKGTNKLMGFVQMGDIA